MKISNYIKRQRAARDLFRTTRSYYGFHNLETAPKGLKKTCYYAGVRYGGSKFTDLAMFQLTNPKGRKSQISDAMRLRKDMREAYRYGNCFDSYSDYQYVTRYLYQLSFYAASYPLTWWWYFHRPI